MPKPILVSLDADADPPVTVSIPDYVVKKRKARRIVWKKDPASPRDFRFRYLSIDGGGSMFVNPKVRRKSVEITDLAQHTVVETAYWYVLTVESGGVPYTTGLSAAPDGVRIRKKKRKGKGKGEVVLEGRPVIRNR
jgi:hypothetical protein